MNFPMGTGSTSLLICGFLITAALGGELAYPNYNLPLDRPYTLQEAAPFILEREFARQMRAGKPMFFIFPRPCALELDSSRVCGEPHGFTWQGHPGMGGLSISPQAGFQFRIDGESTSAFEMGALATGHRGPLSAYVDARTYTELHEDPNHESYDREFVEKQSEDASGSIAYSSFSRYRANLGYDVSWGRFSVGRDAAHWGPGLYTNLVFSRSAVPFNHATFTTRVGPLSIHSLYGQLTESGDREFLDKADSRTVYAHRYELTITRDWMLGVSEQLISSGHGEPFAFIPVVPLFIFKGDGYEHLNNGNIAMDLTWRPTPWSRIYGEFLVDDLQSPTSLFDNQWGNKWGAMSGIQLSLLAHEYEAGAILEVSRIEPWVYTHYHDGTSQAANHGYPLGNSEGPNSQAAVFRSYLVRTGIFSLMAGGNLTWKGTDLGSRIEDVRPGSTTRKEFLAGIGKPEIGFSIVGTAYWRSFACNIGLWAEEALRSSIRVSYQP